MQRRRTVTWTKGRVKRGNNVESEGWSWEDSQLAEGGPVWASEETWTAVDKEVDAG